MEETVDESLSAVNITTVERDEVVNQTLLVCRYECKIFKNDYENKHDEIENFSITKVDEIFPLSYRSFPAITKIHTTGSRSENLWTVNSDEDILYEVGPGFVHQPNEKSIKGKLSEWYDWLAGHKYFIWEETEHFGHYRIEDLKGGYLYPQDLQMKLAPTIQYLKQKEKKGEPSRTATVSGIDTFGCESEITLNDSKRKQKKNEDEEKEKTEAAITLSDNCDHIIGLRLNQWPESIKNHLNMKLAQNKLINLDLLLGNNNF